MHTLRDVRICHPHLAARVDYKCDMLLMAHPPHLLGREISSQPTHANSLPS